MESPRAVQSVVLGAVAAGLLTALGLSMYLGEFSFFFMALLGVLGCGVVAVLLGLMTAPMVWLLSRLAGRNPKRKS